MSLRLFLSVSVLAFLAASFAACKRDDDPTPDTNATRIIGSWRESYRAVDSNANGRVDSNERIPTSSYRVMTFYANGSVRDTAFVNGVASNVDATYSIDDQYLDILFPGIPAYRIIQLDAAALVLRDTAGTPQVAIGFRKQ